MIESSWSGRLLSWQECLIESFVLDLHLGTHLDLSLVSMEGEKTL